MENQKPIPPEVMPDWEIGELYSKSWELIKKYKVLWVFGMALAGFNLGSSFNGFNSSGSTDFNFDQPAPSSPNSVGSMTQVLGATNSDQFGYIISQFFSEIPTFIYLLFGLEILFLFIVFITLGIIRKAWATGSLIHSIQSGINNTKPTIRNSSEKAFANIKSLVWLQIVPSLVLALVAILVMGLTGLVIAAFESPIRGIFILVLLLEIAILVYVFIRLAMSLIWAEREVILNNKPAQPAFFTGLKISKKKFWPMILLGLVNTILSGIIIGLPLIIIFGFIVGGLFSADYNQLLGFGIAGIGAILFLGFIIGFILLSGILTAFKAAVWTIAYNNIKGKYE